MIRIHHRFLVKRHLPRSSKTSEYTASTAWRSTTHLYENNPVTKLNESAQASSHPPDSSRSDPSSGPSRAILNGNLDARRQASSRFWKAWMRPRTPKFEPVFEVTSAEDLRPTLESLAEMFRFRSLEIWWRGVRYLMSYRLDETLMGLGSESLLRWTGWSESELLVM